MRKVFIVLVVLGLLSFGAINAHANLVVNSDFKSPDLGWTYAGSGTWDSWDPGHGDYREAYVNCFQEWGTVSQTIATTTGNNYMVSFWYSSNGVDRGELTVSFAGTTLLDLTDVPDSYTECSVIVTAATASSLFEFKGEMTSGTYFLDDVSITDLGPSSSVPEPASMLLVGSGLLGLAAFRRKLEK